MLLAQRKLKLLNSEIYQEEYRLARNSYFSAIKHAKKDHWNSFLEASDPKTIYKAFSYTKPYLDRKLPTISGQTSFEGKATMLKTTLFPKPPSSTSPDWAGYTADSWPELAINELKLACSTKIKGKTPGPDGITQDIINKAYQAIPNTFFQVYSLLINFGYHPICWKQATGAILKKPAKPDYSVPKAYRVISLLNCLGKISERILAKRLAYLAETTSLLHNSQIGSRLKKSAIDTALMLAAKIQNNIKLKTSVLFLDIKGAFDHVSKNQLLAVLKKLSLPISLIAWVSHFLEDRLLRLSFDSRIESFQPINTGIPQGSPISPILFLIYIRDLFPPISCSVWSYMDDIALATSSTSLKKNCRILEREAKKLYTLGTLSSIKFDLDKTELMHFYAGRKATNPVNLPNSQAIHPSKVVRWLGIYFDETLKFKHHTSIRISQAKTAFLRISRLANTQYGLSPFAIRQLYLACVASVSDYGSPIWWKNQASIKSQLQSLQNLALRKILGVFKTSPVMPMEVEAALVPPQIRLDAATRQYAFRTLKLAKNHSSHQLVWAQPLASDSDSDSDNDLIPKNTRLTQIVRIRRSIHHLADFASLEKIQSFKFPPGQLLHLIQSKLAAYQKRKKLKAIKIKP
ncbi:hypothetical protein ACMFMF_011951 [Clarireedia jacksonii]